MRALLLIIIIWALLSAGVCDIHKRNTVGKASWYNVKTSSYITASGERFDESKLTCAYWNVKFGTLLKITNIITKKFVIVRCNDRGPNQRLVKRGIIIDLTPKGFSQIANLKDGLVMVQIEILK